MEDASPDWDEIAKKSRPKTHLQEGSASRTRSSYHQGHLTSLQDTVEVSEEEFFVLSQTVGVRGGFLLLRLDRVAELGPFGVLELGEGVEHAVDKEGRKERNQDVSSPMDKRKARRGRRRGRVEPKGENKEGKGREHEPADIVTILRRKRRIESGNRESVNVEEEEHASERRKGGEQPRRVG